MRDKLRLLVRLFGLPAMLAGSLIAAVPAGADEDPQLTIGVDNLSPRNENFGFLDYYPREGTKVHNGDVVAFNFTPPSTSDEIHTATLGTPGRPAADTFNDYPPFIADTDDPVPPGSPFPFQAQIPNTVIFPSKGAPATLQGGCGDAANPCPYDGTTDLNSGILCKTPLCPNSQYFYKIQVSSVPAGGLTVHFVCLIHGPVMSGALTVVPSNQPASTQKKLDAAAKRQYAPQIGLGKKAKAAALDLAEGSNQVIAGTQSPDGHVQVLEMLPKNFEVDAGKNVTWKNIANNEIHTVTFPQGPLSDPVDPFPAVCEGGQGVPDIPFTGGPGIPCGNLDNFELHFNPQPQGPTVIERPGTSANPTVATSGILLPGAFPPFPDHYTFSFPNPGSFAYQCKIHDHMIGTIVVEQGDRNDD